eukprot:m.118383 g.118383  ORF g.118383 m.118383 type:complete len:338 (+) comp9229_c0_seq1:31-1044(+)
MLLIHSSRASIFILRASGLTTVSRPHLQILDDADSQAVAVASRHRRRRARSVRVQRRACPRPRERANAAEANAIAADLDIVGHSAGRPLGGSSALTLGGTLAVAVGHGLGARVGAVAQANWLPGVRRGRLVHGGHQRIEGGRHGGNGVRGARPRPVQAVVRVRAHVVRKNRPSVEDDEGFGIRESKLVGKVVKMADKNPLKELLVTVASPAARLEKDAVVCKDAHCSLSDVLGDVGEGGVAGVGGELAEAVEQHTLIIGPRRAIVVDTLIIQAIVQKALRVQHAAALQPGPRALCPLQIEVRVAAESGSIRVEAGGRGQEQLVCDGVLVGSVCAARR